MLQITPQMRILAAIDSVDGRKGIDSLAALCREKLQANHNKLTEKNVANETTTFAYDAGGFLTSRKDNLQNAWT